MINKPRFSRKPLLAVAIDDRRRVHTLLVAVVLWAFLGWALTSILAGRGEPFEYAIHNYSLGELRIVLWIGTLFLTAGIAWVGWSFVTIGKSLAREARASWMGFHMSANGDGVYDKFVRWYGAVLVVAGGLMIPLGASLLVILASCRYMRDV